MNGAQVPTPEMVGVIFGCTVAGLAVLKLDSMVRARLAARRAHPWPKVREPHNVVILPRTHDGHGDPYDWKRDDPWSSPRLFKRQ
jgi:hypothetical protein